MSQHCAHGASGSKRWLICSGSIRESRGCADTTSIYAIEGTAAHDVAAQCLKENRDAIEFADRYIKVQEGPDEAPVIHQILVTEEMVEGVQLYLDLCHELAGWGFNPDIIQFVEEVVSLNDLDPSFPEPLFGTCDYGLYDRRAQRLTVTDFKFGQGVVVEAGGNTQIRYYAVGLLLKLLNEPVKDVELIICQPRGFHAGLGPIRREVITVEELLRWAQEELLIGAWKTLEPDAPLVPGEHCQFCPAAASCKALREHALEQAMVLFDPVDAMPVEQEGPPPPQKLTVEQIAKLLDHSGTIMMWLRSVREYAFDLLNAGVEIPDWKIVGKQGRRRWVGNAEDIALELIMMMGLPDEELWDKKLKSPAKMERVVRKQFGTEAQVKRKYGPKYHNVYMQLAGLYEKPTSGTTLARKGDPREELIGTDVSGFERLDP